MPMMKSPYEQHLATTTGHMLYFPANVPVYVPPEAVQAAINHGIIHSANHFDVTPAGEMPPTLEQQLAVVAPEETSDNERDAEAEFAVALDQALLRILTRNDPSDLKADLSPKIVRVTAEMSPDIRRPTATEISDAYQRLQENIDLAE